MSPPRMDSRTRLLETTSHPQPAYALGAERPAGSSKLSDDAQLLATSSKLPKHLDQVGIVLHWQATTKRPPRIATTPHPTLKALIDGLVRYGLVEDDNSERVTSGCVIESVAAHGTAVAADRRNPRTRSSDEYHVHRVD